ncbi:MAG: iron-sulfur cluster assembly accessory protein [Acetobacteraceae bacterium]|jgi:iron-sulfur cluster assembly accessory protein
MNLTMTAAAEKFIRRLLRFDGGPGAGFRLKVSPGGCSGLAADFSVASAPAPGEQAFTVNGVTLFLPAESRLLLDGVTIDFSDTPLQSGFVFNDPNQVACGHSPTVLVSLDTFGRG